MSSSCATARIARVGGDRPTIISIIGIIVTAIIVAVSIAGAATLLSACGDFGPGVHVLDNGTTLTCGG